MSNKKETSNKKQKAPLIQKDKEQSTNLISSDKEQDIRLLKSVLKNCETGVDSIDYLLPEVESDNLAQILKTQKIKLKTIIDQTNHLAQKHTIELTPNGCFKKHKIWLQIRARSFFEDDTQHLTEIIMQQFFVSITDLIKNLSNSKQAKKDILKITKELKTGLENSINELVLFLEKTQE